MASTILPGSEYAKLVYSGLDAYRNQQAGKQSYNPLGALGVKSLDSTQSDFLKQFTYWLNTQRGGAPTGHQAILADIAKNGLDQYAGDVNAFGDWYTAKVAKDNASGALSGTLGMLIPTVMGAVAGNPFAGALAGTAQQGVASGGNLLSMVGGGLGGYAGAGIPSKIGGLIDKAQSALSPTAFVNPNALGISPSNLYSPASLASSATNPLAASLYNPTFFGGLPAAVQANLTKALGLPTNAADSLYTPSFQPTVPGQAPISTPSNNPSNVVQGKGGSVLGAAGKTLANTALNTAVSSLLSPPAEGGGGSIMPPSANTWGVNPYNKSPYPELFMRPRRGISNQLVV